MGIPVSAGFIRQHKRGDGHRTSGGVVSGSGGFNIRGSHTYSNSGTPSVTVSVTDQDGASGFGLANEP